MRIPLTRTGKSDGPGANWTKRPAPATVQSSVVRNLESEGFLSLIALGASRCSHADKISSAPNRQFAQISRDFSSLNAVRIPIEAHTARQKNFIRG